jgi:hypothetical protein
MNAHQWQQIIAAPSPLSEVGSVACRQLLNRLHPAVHLQRHMQMASVAATIDVTIATVTSLLYQRTHIGGSNCSG